MYRLLIIQFSQKVGTALFPVVTQMLAGLHLGHGSSHWKNLVIIVRPKVYGHLYCIILNCIELCYVKTWEMACEPHWELYLCHEFISCGQCDNFTDYLIQVIHLYVGCQKFIELDQWIELSATWVTCFNRFAWLDCLMSN